MKLKLKRDEILVLRTVFADMTSTNDFRWPRKGRVVAEDWEDTDACGNGLHGLPWGCGGAGYLSSDSDATWLVVRVSTKPGGYRHGTGEMTDKCKFRAGSVVYAGTRPGAVALIAEHAPANSPIVYRMMDAGGESTQTAGYGSTQKAGYGSSQTVRWYDGNAWQCKVRVAGNAEADKWWRFENGDWRLATADEIAEAENKVQP